MESVVYMRGGVGEDIPDAEGVRAGRTFAAVAVRFLIARGDGLEPEGWAVG